MSGITGIVGRAGIDPAALDALVILLPGRRIEWQAVSGSAEFASSEQPLLRDHCLVAADARLVDRDSLAARLGLPVESSDTALLLAAYLKWGAECVQHLRGDFAFCVVDQQQVFCARDHLGVKPLYYAVSPAGFVFASEARAVASQTGRHLNEQRIADYLVYPMEHADLTSTCYEKVFRLPPATTLQLDIDQLCGHTVRQRRYWQPGVAFDPELTDAAAIDEFRALLSLAIEERQRPAGSNADFAISLSGGLDSSLVAAVASRRHRVLSYSTKVEAADCEESALIGELQQSLAIRATTVSLSSLSALESKLQQLISRIGEPFDDNMLQMMVINEVAADAGHQVLADGVEGDLVYSLPASYPAYLMRTGQLVSGLSEAWGQRLHSYGAPHSGWSIAARMTRTLASAPFRAVFGRTNASASPDLGPLIDPAFAADMHVRQRLESMQQPAETLADLVLRRTLHPAIPAALERYDRVAARSGIEPLHPLLDVRLVMFALTLPWRLRCRHGWDKFLIRQAGAGLVPESVTWQLGKWENAWRFNEWFFERHKDSMREQIAGCRNLLQHYVSPETLNNPDDEALWRLYILGSWLSSQ